MPNLNTPEYLEKVKIRVLENLRNTGFRPSVSAREVPKSVAPELDENEDEDEQDKDVRITCGFSKCVTGFLDEGLTFSCFSSDHVRPIPRPRRCRNIYE